MNFRQGHTAFLKKETFFAGEPDRLPGEGRWDWKIRSVTSNGYTDAQTRKSLI
jgi:hypothetical protein